MPRAAVRSITGLIGNNPPPDVIQFKVDQDTVHVGGAITGTVQLVGYEHRRKSPSVHLVLHGLEYTVVALPQSADNSMGRDYLKKNTTESKILIREELTMPDCGKKPQPFRFALPEDLPGTLRCVLDGTDPLLPSQCQIKYTVTASIHNQLGGEPSCTLVTHPIVVMHKEEIPESTPLDYMLPVSVEASIDILFKSIFSCGSMCAQNHTDEPIAKERYILLDTAFGKDFLYLSAGQSLKLLVQDWFGQLRGRGVWMIRVIEELRWTAQGRTAHNRQTWDLFANHHELPTTLRRSYDQKKTSLLTVRHEIVVYLTTRGPSKEILATTEPIPVRILSSNRGWDA
jgi:hypothetical protein